MPSVNSPVTLGALPTETNEKVWAFNFGLIFDRAILDPENLNYNLEIDSLPTFASPNFKRYTKTSSNLNHFQEGPIGKAFEIELPGRAKDVDTTWYWRIRINDGKFFSPYSDTRILIVPKREDISKTQVIFDALADDNAYSKEANSSNVYKLLLQVGRELDLLTLEADRTITDLALDATRDTALIGNFSDYLNLTKVATEPAVSHRWKTNKLWKAFTNLAGTEQGLIDSIIAFTAEPPLIIDLTRTNGWILNQNLIEFPTHPELTPVIIIYSEPNRGHSFILNIYNSWNLSYDNTVLEYFISRQKPAHSEITINYISSRHWSLRYNLQSDWSLWTNSGTIDLTTYPNSIMLSAGATTGTLTSPVEIVTSVSGVDRPHCVAFEAPEIFSTLYGQTVTIEARTSSDGSTFGPYTTLEHGVIPGSGLAIHDYAQFRITLSRGNSGQASPVLHSFEYKGLRI